MAVIAAYRRVLRNGALARLLFGEFVSSVGDWLYLVALLIVVYAEQNDAVALGIIGAARVLPYVFLSVPAGIAADRFDRRLILIVTDVARGLIMLVIAAAVLLGAPVLVIVALAILATCFSAFFSPTIGAFLPTLVRDESELGPANSAWAGLDNLAFFVGPAIAAVLLSAGGLVAAFLINAFTFAVVALVLWRLPVPASAGATSDAPDSEAPGAVPPVLPSGLRETLAGVHRPLAALVAISLVGGFVFGGLGVMTVVLAVDVFGTGEAGTGLLNSAIGVGGVLGALTAGVLVLRRRLGPPLVGGSLVIAAAVGVLGFVPDFSLALLAIGAAAAGAMLVDIVSTTLFQRVVPDNVRGRTLGVIETLYVLAYSAGSFAMPVLGAVDPGPVMGAAGVAMAVSGILALALLGRFAVQEPPIDDARRQLADVPLFAGLPPARLERAMAAATINPMRSGDVIIHQGDEADRFYVIVEGEVEVTQVAGDDRGARLVRRMGPRQVFGEIGLLSGVPRTATVTAVTDGRLLALDGEPFLQLVGTGPGLTYRLLDLHRGASTAG
ncbi:MAG TPA: MFS transporter [Candidatus Caenarcaniphilales bacterium]|nr:MFS transporter [Candidatus Caenarcaniphilales bacterium]